MKVINLAGTDSVLHTFIAQIRDRKVQKDRMRFRRNLVRVGQVFGYEISKTMKYSLKEVTTPLATAMVSTYDDKVVVASILRAGLPLQEGLLEFFDDAESAFVAAYRKYDSDGEFNIRSEYCTCPSLEGKTLILADTMIATGSSVEVALEILRARGGDPDTIHLVCPVASSNAIEFLSKHCPDNVTLWIAAEDPELTNHSFVIPGLGDAGDLAYGDKI